MREVNEEGGAMRNLLILILVIFLTLGCARVKVEAPKEPIKVDISMRLDIYQHVAKDIDQIEDIVSGSKAKTEAKEDKRSLLHYLVRYAYAEEGLSPQVEQAALRRKDRLQQLSPLEKDGVVGENKFGLVEIRKYSAATPQAKQLVDDENNDRTLIYESVAQKNGTSVREVQKIYGKRLRKDAPNGTPVESLNTSTGIYEWRIKDWSFDEDLR
jgi:uncharacterized protein YdbL (DUF1318 family)